ncbi:2-oxoglutarate-dependent dioxygenase AOP1 [Actinidia chinensis var. chinensis]|uniref:2-oxoglutarate-dependent dioxygenase DAO n=1 Tax=Actinidia chinensis var. chinensis TaxID=1590841 RepID=A0A2R6RFW9_ACTCC|nr:2-oxoglutarate-dependent dioxygenase AOP1 [Actinidia chinensis var. chinensis]
MVEAHIPHLEIPIGRLDIDQGSELWKAFIPKVREACERHGCFFLKCDKFMPMNLFEEMFKALESLFHLPEETKRKYTNPNLFHGYLSTPLVSTYESFGINGTTHLDVAQAFTNLMWPDGNSNFFEVLNTMSSKMLELNLIILKLIFESFHMKNYYRLHCENNSGIFRMIKYKVPASNDSPIGLVPHTDKNFLTILCDNEVHGLEILCKDTIWAPLMIPKGSFIVFVGDSLKAWSNGRLHAVKHRVMMREKKVRYSCGLFLTPKEGVNVEVPEKLVDEDHPLLYKPFNYSDFMAFFASNYCEEALQVYAGA